MTDNLTWLQMKTGRQKFWKHLTKFRRKNLVVKHSVRMINMQKAHRIKRSQIVNKERKKHQEDTTS